MVLAAFPFAAQAGPWVGNWIWAKEPTRELFFRRSFDLPGKPRRAWLSITADNIYTAYLNGEEIGTDDDWTGVETYDVASRLRKGPNLLAVRAVDPGPDAGGLLAELIVIGEDGRRRVIATDSRWRMNTSAPEGWNEDPEYDDSGWAEPTVFGPPPVEPWRGLPHPDPGPRVEVEMKDLVVQTERSSDGSTRVRARAVLVRSDAVGVPGRVGILFRKEGETVVESWIEPSFQPDGWPVGVPATIEFPSFAWPPYAPQGTFEVVVAGDGFESAPPRSWRSPFLRRVTQPAVPLRLPALDAGLEASVGGGRDLRISLQWESEGGDPAINGFLGLVYDRENLLRDVLRLGRQPDGNGIPPGRGSLVQKAPTLDWLPAGEYRLEVRPAGPWAGRPPETTFGIPDGPARAPRPLGHGVYRDDDGFEHFWYVNRGNTLIWDGEPFYPAGGMYLSTFLGGYRPGDPAGNTDAWNRDVEHLRALRAAGIRDLYLNPCRAHADSPVWVWQRIIDLFEQEGFRYAWQITEPHAVGQSAPAGRLQPLKGFAASRGSWKAEWSAPGETVRCWIASGFFGRTHPDNRVFAAAFADGEDLLWIRRAAVGPGTEGVTASITIPEGSPERGTVVFIPELTYRGDMHDYWTSLDQAWLDRFHAFAARLRFGPGFRGFIDPIDNEQSFRDVPNLVPSCAAFRRGFADWLEERYQGNLTALAASWKIDPAPESWETAAALVPAAVRPPDSDRGLLFDPEDPDRTAWIDLEVSQYWYDLIEYRSVSIREFNLRAADVLKKAHDVPVVLKLTENPGFTNPRTAGGFDGLGMEAYGTPPELTRGCGGGVFARAAQAGRTMWELVTETGRAAPGESGIGYPTPATLIRDLASMTQIGAKGVYVFYLNAAGDRPSGSFHDFNLFLDRRQLRWLGLYGRILDRAPGLESYRPFVHFAFPSRWPGETAFHRRAEDFSTPPPHVSVRNRNGAWVVPVRDLAALRPAPATRLIVNLDRDPGRSRFLPLLERGPFPEDRILAVELPPEAGPSEWEEEVAELDLPPDPYRNKFFSEILGIRFLDIGPALEGVVMPANPSLGTQTELLLWNLTGNAVEIGAAGIDPDEVEGAVSVAPDEGAVRFVLPPNAEREVVLPGRAAGGLSGIEEANLAVLLPRLRSLRERASALGIDPEAADRPEPRDRRLAAEEIRSLETRVWEKENTAIAPRIGAVKIDGDLAEWEGRSPSGRFERRVAVDYAEPAPPPPGTMFWIGWDETNLYVACRVKDLIVVNEQRDGALWNGDALEIVVEFELDPGDTSGEYDRDTFQFLLAPTSADGTPAVFVRGGGRRPDPPDAKDVTMAARIEPGGWSLEAAIPWGKFSPAAPDPTRLLGFTAALDRSDGGDRREQFLWRGRPDFAHNRGSLGRLRLVPASREENKP